MTTSHRLHRGPAAALALLGSLALLLGLAPFTATASASTTTRLSASDNVGAALAWSGETFAPGTAPQVLLARDDLFADSLASGAAQARIDAPLLLTGDGVVDPRVFIELQRLGADRVVILGGDVALSESIDTQLEAAGYDTERVFGITRVETAIAVTDRFFPAATRAIIARAFEDDEPTQAFADSLATGAFSASTNLPVLYSEIQTLSPSTREFLQSSHIAQVTLAGGADALSPAVAEEIRALGIEVVRVEGSNRFSTATAMAGGRGFASAGRAERVILTEGASPDAWADGFSAAMQAAGSGAPLVLSDNGDLPAETRAYLADAEGRIALVCGPFVQASACTAASEEMGNE